MNNIDTPYASKLLLDNLIVNHASIDRGDSFKSGSKLQVSFKQEVKRNERENKAIVILSADIHDDNGQMSVKVIMSGYFRLEDNDIDSDFAKQIFEQNTVAIMFPYLRSQITLITTQPNMAPIVLPALNIGEMLAENEE